MCDESWLYSLCDRRRVRYSSECFVDGDDADEHTRLRIRDGILGLQFGAFRVEQGEKVGCTFPIPHAGNRGGAAALPRLLDELDEALLILAIGDERVRGFLERPQYNLFEGGDRLARGAFGAAQPCPRAADVE